MPLRNPQKFLYDIVNCCEFVLEMTKGKTVEEYKNDRIFRSALEREPQIIGEAMLQLDNTFPEISEQIAQHRSIIGFRHVLVHGYASLDPDTVWNVVETKIVTLLQQAQTLLKKL